MATQSKPVHPLRKAHTHIKSSLPVVTALITILGTAVAVMEHHAHDDDDQVVDSTHDDATHTTTKHVWHHIPAHKHITGTLWVLGTRLLAVLIGLAVLVGALALLMHGAYTLLIVVFTVLCMVSVWLAWLHAVTKLRNRLAQRWNRK